MFVAGSSISSQSWHRGAAVFVREVFVVAVLLVLQIVVGTCLFSCCVGVDGIDLIFAHWGDAIVKVNVGFVGFGFLWVVVAVEGSDFFV